MIAAAKKAYDETRDEIRDLLDSLYSGSTKYDDEETIHWGHVGDMAHVASKLTEILDFLRGDK